MAVAIAAASLLAGCGGEESGGGGGSGGSGGGGSLDACAIVTAADATALFGQPASPDTGSPILDPTLLGECLWEWHNIDNDSHLLQFYVWGDASYYSAPADSQPFAIGEGGYIRINTVAGVDIEWVQDDGTVVLSYSTVGSSIPNATTKEAEMKALAQKTSTALTKP